jgi:hypothetical protein
VRWFLILLVACVALTALKFAAVALALVLVITILWGAYAHPGELFGTLAFFLIANLMMTHTVASLTLVGFLSSLLLVCGGEQGRSREQTTTRPEQRDGDQPGPNARLGQRDPGKLDS